MVGFLFLIMLIRIFCNCNTVAPREMQFRKLVLLSDDAVVDFARVTEILSANQPVADRRVSPYRPNLEDVEVF
ncbi:MAG: hypothetical protein EON58_16285 [Alphaproteobacteria bacterium]|nr:MAG: hypothetical protein EON58_16285 [Alphaproteobacteria bacterium]